MSRRAFTAALRPFPSHAPRLILPEARRHIAGSAARKGAEGGDPRELGRRILDDFAYLKERYCRLPCSLANSHLSNLTFRRATVLHPYSYIHYPPYPHTQIPHHTYQHHIPANPR